jgi:hypothetical protein
MNFEVQVARCDHRHCTEMMGRVAPFSHYRYTALAPLLN